MSKNSIDKNLHYKKNLYTQDELIGRGYSGDSQQTAINACYNTTIYSISGEESTVKLSEAMTFEEFTESLNIDFSGSGNIYGFEFGGEFDYFQFIKDEYLSISLNYYQVAYSKASLQVHGAGTDMLSPDGKALYNNGSNPYFNIVCGDNVISSYNQGALLAMSIKIVFKSHYDMQEYTAEAGGSYAGIFSASTKVQDIVTHLNIQGTISMSAFQKGGEPSKLSNILAKDTHGDYYLLSCSLQNMDACNKVANGLLEYAQSDFSSQFSVTGDKNITILGIGQYSYEPTYYFGLPVKSIVTPEIKQDRIKLSEALKEYKYYYQPLLKALVNDYPVQWDINSNTYKDAMTLNKQVINNAEIILNSDPQIGAIGCFNRPDQCPSITKAIFANINPVTSKNLDFLEKIKYFINIGGNGPDSCFKDGTFANLYYNGVPYNGDPWGFVALPGGSDHITKVYYTWINETKAVPIFPYISDLSIKTHSNQDINWRFYDPIVDTNKFQETMTWYQPGGSGHGTGWGFYICKSPFYFDTYNHTNAPEEIREHNTPATEIDV